MRFQLNDITSFKQKALQWAHGFTVACYLDSNNFADAYSKFDVLIAAGVKHCVTSDERNALASLTVFKAKHQDWMTGFLGYDLKNETEELNSENKDHLGFPDLYFFVPAYLLIINGDEVEIKADDAKEVYNTINATELQPALANPKLKIKTRIGKREYIETVTRIKQHINLGDIYVTNFCQEFYSEEAVIDPVDIFLKLAKASPNPFSCFFKFHDKFILCASPERFLAKRGNKLISQPIKGTARRDADNIADEKIKHQLKNSLKEQQENVMIVDLVRNDLTRCATPGTVKVEELFGIYSFKHLHQMVSTVVCELNEQISEVEVLRNTFPMGSMTGAPKVKAMQLMEHYEHTKRGIYSSAIGYFSPDGDFDFNVVIRSILYNASNRYLSFQAGSAITHNANAAYEYQECLLKVKAILEVLVEREFSPQP